MYQALRSAAVRWLTLLVGLPETPTRHRVGVWRKLQRMGAVRLRGSAWILPETAETKELFEWLVQEEQSGPGAATPRRGGRNGTDTEGEMDAHFLADPGGGVAERGE